MAGGKLMEAIKTAGELGILSSLLVGSHEGSHNTMAQREKVPITWSGLKWNVGNTSRKKLLKISSAGFAGQEMARPGDESLGKKYDFLNALHKASYLVKDRGDIGLAEKSGGKYMKEALTASALSDILHGMGATKGRIIFVAPEGAPGIAYTRRW